MKWYSGNIAEAIQFSHSSKALFCVFVLGNDDVSLKLETALDNENVGKLLTTTQFVCIRISADSQEHKQFSEIYSNVVSPSIYCITDKGVPVEIITQLLSPSELAERFGAALNKHRVAVGLATELPDTQTTASGSVSEAAGSSKSDSQPPNPGLIAANEAVTAAEAAINEPELTLNEKIERARKLALAKQHQKLEQEKEDAKRMERERRLAGKGMAELKRWQEEEETKRALEERKKDKIQEQQLRQRLREQIAQDRAERNARSNVSYINDGAEPVSASRPSPPLAATIPSNYTGKARLQFRMPDGSSQTHTFEKEVNLGYVRNFLIENNLLPFRDFSMWVAYPRREFTGSDYDLSLQELGLLPSTAILIIPRTRTGFPVGQSMSSSLWTFITTLLGTLMFPITYIFTYVQRAISAPPRTGNTSDISGGIPRGGRGNTLGGSRRDNPGGAPGSSSQGSSTAPKTTSSSEHSTENSGKNSSKSDKKKSEGNVHRLRTSESDSDDEKATWNGNSTQQM